MGSRAAKGIRTMRGGLMRKPIAVFDLFSGGGGFAEGAIQAGAIVPMSIDFWTPANAVHQANHPDTRVIHRELGADREADIRLLKRWFSVYRGRGYHIHFHGSPPCQALSNASKTDASKGMGLVLYFLDLVQALEPDSWSMENVIPMAKRLPEGTPFVKLNAADFGVPQTRRRCIAGEGWEAVPSHSKTGDPAWRSVLDALPHLEEEISHLRGYSRNRPVMERGKYVGMTPRHPPDGTRPLEEPSYAVCTGSMEGWMINTAGAGPSVSRRARSGDRSIDSPSLTIHNNRPTLRIVKLEALGSNAKRHQDRTVLEPSKTICGSGNQCGPRLFDHDEITATKIRSLTVAETASLQGFPPEFDFEAATTQKNRWTIIGNAVPPAIAKAIIEGITQ